MLHLWGILKLNRSVSFSAASPVIVLRHVLNSANCFPSLSKGRYPCIMAEIPMAPVSVSSVPYLDFTSALRFAKHVLRPLWTISMEYVQMPSTSWFSHSKSPDATGMKFSSMSTALILVEPSSIPSEVFLRSIVLSPYLSFQARSLMNSSSSSLAGVVSLEMCTNSISIMFAQSRIISAVTS